MTSNYHFVTNWRVRGELEQVASILNNPVELPRWWPSVYISVSKFAEDRYDLHTRGWLPYTLRWRMRRIADRFPHGFIIEATGDFEGSGEWTLRQDGEFVDLFYDWKIRAEKPLLRALSFLLRPAFAANHRWAMRQGEICLQRELDKHR